MAFIQYMLWLQIPTIVNASFPESETYNVAIDPPSTRVSFNRATKGLERIPAAFRRQAGSNPDKPPATHRDKQPFTLTWILK